MTSPTAGMWECRHGVDGRDHCTDCYGPADGPPGVDVDTFRAWIAGRPSEATTARLRRSETKGPTMKRITSRDVDCPTCGAPKGERCRGSAYSGRGHHTVDYHMGRREVAAVERARIGCRFEPEYHPPQGPGSNIHKESIR